jgi:phosphoribosylformimino-5-aminoimidazole carboxamide ribotide isomerase
VSPRQTSTFAILPAIDLRGGRVVRLRQGDFDREQVYAEDPVAVTAEFAAAGAEWIHVVDLDGARAGGRRQASTIAAIVAALDGAGPRLQVAGGLRSPEAIADVLEAGAERVVIGTLALRDPDVVASLIGRHGPGRIAVALDVRDGMAIGDGWVPGAAGVPVADALARLEALGVATFAVTSIERDGLLGGPDLALLESCVGSTAAIVVASGGIRSVADLQAVRDIGCGGAIVGRAIYDGSLDLRAAIAAITAISEAAPGPG